MVAVTGTFRSSGCGCVRSVLTLQHSVSDMAAVTGTFRSSGCGCVHSVLTLQHSVSDMAAITGTFRSSGCGCVHSVLTLQQLLACLDNVDRNLISLRDWSGILLYYAFLVCTVSSRNSLYRHWWVEQLSQNS